MSSVETSTIFKPFSQPSPGKPLPCRFRELIPADHLLGECQGDPRLKLFQWLVHETIQSSIGIVLFMDQT